MNKGAEKTTQRIRQEVWAENGNMDLSNMKYE